MVCRSRRRDTSLDNTGTTCLYRIGGDKMKILLAFLGSLACALLIITLGACFNAAGSADEWEREEYEKIKRGLW